MRIASYQIAPTAILIVTALCAAWATGTTTKLERIGLQATAADENSQLLYENRESLPKPTKASFMAIVRAMGKADQSVALGALS